MKALFIDHYDSFSFNVLDLLEKCGISDIEHIYFDQVDLDNVPKCDFLVLSPGPNHPDDAQVSVDLISRFHQNVPIFGICLGLQLICKAFGAAVSKVPAPHHGATKNVDVEDSSVLFKGLGRSIKVASYNSLRISISEFSELDHEFSLIARSDDGSVEAIERASSDLPYIAATQFHPESFLSEKSIELASNFIEKVKRDKNRT
ncbi:aminodeoxychorismate/anthranilate synthase component II [bacterium]|nr:aminodeoxychorismate/anthranilate synthase component II [bacterium]